MNKYDPKKIESKWQKKWEEDEIYKTSDDPSKEKFYILDMFPYPSGEGLHVGHPKGYIATDIISRYQRMNGKNVLHPMGWDAFGLPAENYAIKNKIHPRIAVDRNIKRYKEQLSIIGIDYDWDREINTTNPEYYHWTQWIFLQMFKKGLAYESNEPINWCPSCLTGLANEDLDGDKCERCGTKVEQRPIRQWVLRITDYAEKLLSGLEKLDWPESIKILQKNWIGKSRGVKVKFKTDAGLDIEIFTTRIDTIFSGTYLVVAPGSKYMSQLFEHATNKEELRKYIDESLARDIANRSNPDKEVTGVEMKGVKAINPATDEEMPIWTADFVLEDYGTGAVFADAHDKRDFDLAKKHNIPLKVSIKPAHGEADFDMMQKFELCFEGEGVLVNSGEFDGLESVDARPKIIKWLSKKNGSAEETINYKLRDWVFSRQRYWGEPIPLIHCEKCGVVPVPEDQLPVKLPPVDSYEPSGTGESPLAKIDEWVNVACPKCAGSAMRETNTMPQWAGSCWYYLRFEDNKNSERYVDKMKDKYWSPVDLYVGGAEHATRHLIYARFWHRFLYDNGLTEYEEPFKKLKHVGLIAGPDGRKMSKRFGNVINPDDVVKQFGADSFRLYEMFLGPFSKGAIWSDTGIVGPRRFIEKVWVIAKRVEDDYGDDEETKKRFNTVIGAVTKDIKNFELNTVVSTLMEFVNFLDTKEKVSRPLFETLLKLLAPYAPHVTEELWHILGNTKSIHLSDWPLYDDSIVDNSAIIVVQVNGKVRSQIEGTKDMQEEEVKTLALQDKAVKKWVNGGEIRKIIYIKGRLLNIVV